MPRSSSLAHTISDPNKPNSHQSGLSWVQHKRMTLLHFYPDFPIDPMKSGAAALSSYAGHYPAIISISGLTPTRVAAGSVLCFGRCLFFGLGNRKPELRSACPLLRSMMHCDCFLSLCFRSASPVLRPKEHCTQKARTMLRTTDRRRI